MNRSGVYESWGEPGEPQHEGLTGLTATRARLRSTAIYIGSSVRKFRIQYSEARRRWCLEENWVVGTTHPTDNYLPLDSVSSFKRAVQLARHMARASAIR